MLSIIYRMNILTCSLWGKYQTEFLAKYNENACGGPVVVILKHAAIKEPEGHIFMPIFNIINFTSHATN
jgi:replication factor A1